MGFNPRDVARAGRKVYERHKADFERRHRGKYILISIRTEKIYVAESPAAAYGQAAAEGEAGPFHLMRVGDRTAYRSRRHLSELNGMLSHGPAHLAAGLPARLARRAVVGPTEREQATPR